MSTLGGGNGDGWPPEGGGQPDGLPGLPPEWGTVVIPDDPAELADEAAELRRELRRQTRRGTWRRRLGLPPRAESAGWGRFRQASSAGGEESHPSLGLPLLIMSIAVIATLTSLFAVAWPGRNNHQVLGPQSSRNTAVTTPTAETLPDDLVLADAAGAAVRLTAVTPAAVLLVDDCATCDGLVTDTVAAAPKPVTVLVVGRTVPTLAPDVTRARRLEDPQERLRDALRLGPPQKLAAVVLVARGGEIVQKHSAVERVDTFRAELVNLS
jgi:hypothetical protein